MLDDQSSWQPIEVERLFRLPFFTLLDKARQQHCQHHDASTIQLSTLLSVKTGACPENCSYCPQSGHYETGVVKEKLLPLADVIAAAQKAKIAGATRFCMGAGWRSPTKHGLPQVIGMIKAVNDLGLESCVSLGMLSEEQVEELEEAGLDFYNHNIDTSARYYPKITTTRRYEDRLKTLACLAQSKIHICCGGIIGMGESLIDRIAMLCQLAALPEQPTSIPINWLIKIKGTPLENVADFDPFDFVRMIAVARLMFPKVMLRLSAGRAQMSDECQALCFYAGANSIHCGEKLLVTELSGTAVDLGLFKRLDLSPRL